MKDNNIFIVVLTTFTGAMVGQVWTLHDMAERGVNRQTMRGVVLNPLRGVLVGNLMGGTAIVTLAVLEKVFD